jgi:hypothetical protein
VGEPGCYVMTAAAAVCGSCSLDLVPAWRDGKDCWARWICMVLLGAWYRPCWVLGMEQGVQTDAPSSWCITPQAISGALPTCLPVADEGPPVWDLVS